MPRTQIPTINLMLSNEPLCISRYHGHCKNQTIDNKTNNSPLHFTDLETMRNVQTMLLHYLAQALGGDSLMRKVDSFCFTGLMHLQLAFICIYLFYFFKSSLLKPFLGPPCPCNCQQLNYRHAMSGTLSEGCMKY